MLTFDPVSLNAQGLIRGQVIDKHPDLPSISVNVVITSNDSGVGTTTNLDDHFRFEGVPLGGHQIFRFHQERSSTSRFP